MNKNTVSKKGELEKYELQSLKITSGWKVLWNHFMTADPLQLPEDDDV